MEPFLVRDCTLATIATGIRAQTLAELRDRLLTIPLNSLFFHFWVGRLRTAYDFHEYRNDFSRWILSALNENALAEKVELLQPTDYKGLEVLRNELIDLIDDYLEEKEFIPWAKTDKQFHFMQSKTIVFNTQYQINEPKELVNILPKLTKSSIFFHFIDATLRIPEKMDDFSFWLQNFGNEYENLIKQIRSIDPYFFSLSELQDKISYTVTNYFISSMVEKHE